MYILDFFVNGEIRAMLIAGTVAIALLLPGWRWLPLAALAAFGAWYWMGLKADELTARFAVDPEMKVLPRWAGTLRETRGTALWGIGGAVVAVGLAAVLRLRYIWRAALGLIALGIACVPAAKDASRIAARLPVDETCKHGSLAVQLGSARYAIPVAARSLIRLQGGKSSFYSASRRDEARMLCGGDTPLKGLSFDIAPRWLAEGFEHPVPDEVEALIAPATFRSLREAYDIFCADPPGETWRREVCGGGEADVAMTLYDINALCRDDMVAPSSLCEGKDPLDPPSAYRDPRNGKLLDSASRPVGDFTLWSYGEPEDPTTATFDYYLDPGNAAEPLKDVHGNPVGAACVKQHSRPEKLKCIWNAEIAADVRLSVTFPAPSPDLDADAFAARVTGAVATARRLVAELEEG